ncbi:MAG: primosomal protein N' [Solobacterium sp.]|nr:primosomal protein N' [Solobacterium sp.]
MKVIQCWIEHPARKIDQTFTYLCEENVTAGTRVEVEFNHRTVIGFVESAEETDLSREELEKKYGRRLFSVQKVLDSEPLITAELHDLALWMREATLSATISCFQAMLPAKIKPHTGKHRIVMEKWAEITDQEASLTPKQADAFAWLAQAGTVPYAELRKRFPNQAAQLVKKGVIRIFEKERTAQSMEREIRSPEKKLSAEQQAAMDEITSGTDDVYLIKGVTGSGKTEVYLQLAARALKQNKQVLFLVPEIGLTPQMIDRVSSRFGEDLAIYHSGLNPQEKYEQYRKVRSGRTSIVVGTRSAVFLPFTDLGLIVMDEEHDASYKQENDPAYHCRDIAVWRSRYHHCKLILGSATPSLESYARALKNVYHLIRMDERFNHSVPEIHIAEMRKEADPESGGILSRTLKEKIRERLDHKEQCILLLNRRGYHTMLRCRSCNEVLVCPHCDIAMSWHRDIRRMKCHTCGTEFPVPDTCPACGAKEGFTTFGVGTEKLESCLAELFPDARILRMDRDTTARKNGHAGILEAFGRHEADILVGTQMIAKGLDYPDVTLVGIINGDEGLNRYDFRSCETAFDLLMQASGRSGRAEKTGEVIIQVMDPEHYAVQCAVKQDYDSFYKHEMRFRHAGQYPPYTYMIAVTLSGRNEDRVVREALSLKQALMDESYKTIGVISLLKIRDLSRMRIIMKGKNLDHMRNRLKNVLENTEIREKIRIDVNPMNLE